MRLCWLAFFLTLGIGISCEARALLCHALPAPEKITGAQLLHALYPKLQASVPVALTARKNKSTQTAESKIIAWLKHLEKNHRVDSEMTRNFYEKKWLLQVDQVPESYFNMQARVARELGHGDLDLRESARREMAELVVQDLKTSFFEWLNYLISQEDYSTWLKYWVFTGFTQLGKFDPESGTFEKRSRDTVSPYPELNREALALTIDEVVLKLHSTQRKDLKSFEYLQQFNFAKIYGKNLKAVTSDVKDLRETDGKWVVFPQGSDPKILVTALAGRSTGWCTAGLATAEKHLEAGDFHVYFSKNELGQSVIPRLAVRMQHNSIAEVRGVGRDQNIDPDMANAQILHKKLQEMGPEGDRYLQRHADMKRLTSIENRVRKGESLSAKDLRFLYEIDREIESFGYSRDPRIREILKGRDAREDISLVFEGKFQPHEIALTESEVQQGGFKYYHGSLTYSSRSEFENKALPEYVNGNLNMNFFTDLKGIRLPQYVGGSLNLSSLKDTSGLTLPLHVGRDLDLGNVTSSQSLVLPQHVGGTLKLPKLTEANGLIFPKYLGKHLDLRNLTDTTGLSLPPVVRGDLSLNRIRDATGLVLPRHVEGHLELSGLVKADWLIFPERVGSLSLDQLVDATAIILPTHISGFLEINHIVDLKNTTLPKYVGGDLYLGSVKDANGLIFPEHVGGDLHLTHLTQVKGLVLPQHIGENLFLQNLRQARELILPQHIGKSLHLDGLTESTELTLPRYVGENLNLGSLRKTEGVSFPQLVGGELYLDGLYSEPTELPRHVGGRIHLRNRHEFQRDPELDP